MIDKIKGVVFIPTMLVATFLFAGCSTQNIMSVAGDYESQLLDIPAANLALNQNEPCCSDFSQLPYTQLSNKFNEFVVINQDASSYNFSSGKSYFLAYELPDSRNDVGITISAEILSTVFQPSVLLLDKHFKPTRMISADEFSYQEAYLIDGNRLEATILLNGSGRRGRERYMLIYTTAESLAQTSTVTHPAKLYARGRGNVEPEIADLTIPHSPMGVFSIEVSDPYVASNGYLKLGANNAPGLAAGTVLAVDDSKESYEEYQSKQAIHAPAESVPSKVSLERAMLAETEQFYNKLIQEMVKQGNIEKALKLVEEAEYAGSRSARVTFIEAVKNK